MAKIAPPNPFSIPRECRRFSVANQQIVGPSNVNVQTGSDFDTLRRRQSGSKRNHRQICGLNIRTQKNTDVKPSPVFDSQL